MYNNSYSLEVKWNFFDILQINYWTLQKKTNTKLCKKKLNFAKKKLNFAKKNQLLSFAKRISVILLKYVLLLNLRKQKVESFISRSHVLIFILIKYFALFVIPPLFFFLSTCFVFSPQFFSSPLPVSDFNCNFFLTFKGGCWKKNALFLLVKFLLWRC